MVQEEDGGLGWLSQWFLSLPFTSLDAWFDTKTGALHCVFQSRPNCVAFPY